jgi:hypothetical protein
MEKLNLNKKVYSKNQYERVINTKFSQLATTLPQNQLPQTPIISVEQFFQDYEQIFLQIPKFGELNSHEYLVNLSSEYIGSEQVNDNIQALINEINSLQQQNLELNQQLIELQSPSSQI